jgi:ribonuclease P protein component
VTGPGLRTADFQRLLATRPCARTEHFVLHHLPPARPAAPAAADDLSTPPCRIVSALVDERLRLGLVVPKRHARRAVTRSLIKRQGRAQFAAHAERLARGDWLLRLRSPFAVKQFISATSQPLRLAVQGEMRALFLAATQGVAG